MTLTKKFVGLALLSFPTISLTSCQTDRIKEYISTTVENMLPNLWVTLMQILIFVATLVVVILLAYKPLKKKLSKRSEFIENNIKESQEKNRQADENLQKSNEIVAASEKRAGQIIKEAHTTAEVKVNEMQRELDQAIELQRVQAHKDIESERHKMLREAKAEIVTAAIDASKEVLQREVNKEDNEKYLDTFLSSLDDSNNESEN